MTSKERELVKLRLSGAKHKVAYRKAYNSKANDNTATVESIRTLAKPHVKQAIEPILKRHNIELDTAIAPIGRALTATKQNQFTGEVTEDISLQLQGSDRALKLLGIGQDSTSLHLHQHLHQQATQYDI